MEWARSHLEWGAVKSKNVVVKDEKRFNLDGPDGLSYYWHDLRQTPEIFSKRQQGGASVMVWGAISYYGLCDLMDIKVTLDSKGYCEVLEECLLPFVAETTGENWQLQQDGASVHRSKLTMEWLKEKNVSILSWPAVI